MADNTFRSWAQPVNKVIYEQDEPHKLQSSQLELGKLVIARLRDPIDFQQVWQFWTEVTHIEETNQWLFYLSLNVYTPQGVTAAKTRATFSGSLLIKNRGVVGPMGYLIEPEPDGSDNTDSELIVPIDSPDLVSS